MGVIDDNGHFLTQSFPFIPLRPLSLLIMIPLYLSLAAFSCLSFAGAEPFHIPLVRDRTPLSIEDYTHAADSLRYKYGYTHSSTSKRQNTAAIPAINQVGSHSSP